MKRLLLLLLIPVLCRAQFQFIPISADYASFYSSDTTAFVEIYLSFFQGNLQFNSQPDGSYLASFSNRIEISNEEGYLKDAAHNYKSTTRDTSQLQQYNQFIDVFKVEIPYGDYRVKVEMLDNHSQRKGEYVLSMNTIQPQSSLSFSGIQFSSQISRDTTSSPFRKSGLKVIPHPSGVFTILQPMLYYYVELHNLNFTADEQHEYEFSYYITDSQGDTIRSKPAIRKKIISPMQVEVGGLNVMAFPKNTYFLNLVARDITNGQVAQKRKKFYVSKPVKADETVADMSLPDIAPVYTDFDKEDLENEFAMAKYIASPEEVRIFERVENEEAMKKFLTTFWRERDKRANMAMDGYRRRYMELVEFANTYFGSMGKPGWKTDRGRIVITYGRPDEIERFPSSSDVLPYITWTYYNLEGGADFIFIDQSGFGDYELIHSTYRKELQNPNWQQYLYRQR